MLLLPERWSKVEWRNYYRFLFAILSYVSYERASIQGVFSLPSWNCCVVRRGRNKSSCNEMWMRMELCWWWWTTQTILWYAVQFACKETTTVVMTVNEESWVKMRNCAFLVSVEFSMSSMWLHTTENDKHVVRYKKTGKFIIWKLKNNKWVGGNMWMLIIHF